MNNSTDLSTGKLREKSLTTSIFARCSAGSGNFE